MTKPEATMPPSILRWTFHSPLRLAAVSLTVAVTVVVAVVLASPDAGPAPATTTKAQERHRHGRPADVPSPSPTPSEPVTADDRRRAAEAARLFAATWARDRSNDSRGHWLRDLKPLTTASLHQGLQATDLTRVPRGRVKDVALVRIGSFAGVGTVNLNTGLQLEVHLVTEHGGWVVSDIRPADT